MGKFDGGGGGGGWLYCGLGDGERRRGLLLWKRLGLGLRDGEVEYLRRFIATGLRESDREEREREGSRLSRLRLLSFIFSQNPLDQP